MLAVVGALTVKVKEIYLCGYWRSSPTIIS